MCKNISILICIVFISLVGSVFAGTQVYTLWNGAEGGDWNTAGNWTLTPVGPYTTPTIPLQLDPPGGPQGDYFGKAGFKGTSPNPSPGIVGAVGVDQITCGGTTGGNLRIASGGTINVSEFVVIGNAYSVTRETGILTMNGGTLNCGVMVAADGNLCVGYKGEGKIYMNSGTINLTSYLSIADQTNSIGNVHLDGGTIYATDLRINTANGHLDIRGGTLILDGNDIAAIAGFVSSNKISAYDGAGTVVKDYNVTNTGKTTVTGYLPSPKAINPSPFHNATDVALDVNLSWSAGLGAASHDVYFGTDSTPDETEFQGNQPLSPATFDPCTLLAPSTAYYWRINEVNEANVVTTGDVWSFTTISGQPSSPSPADYATGVAIHPILSWTPGQGALSHDVYFGTASPGTFQGNQPGTTFDPNNLLPNTIYYWQIDEVYSTSTVTGPVWRFTTANTKATLLVSQFCPANVATGMPIGGIILTWTAGVGAVSHDVYLGTDSTPDETEFQGNQPGTNFSPPVLDPNTTYYWRIDEKDGSGGTTTGDVWSFTTGDPVGLYPYLTWRSDPTNSIVVNWWNPAATGDSSVDYGLTSSYGSTVNVPTITNFHHVEVTGLSPATIYHYRVRSSDGTTGSDNTFTTAEANTTSFRFAMYGDPRGTATVDEPYYTRQGILCDWILAQDFDFAIETGDTVWAGASLKGIGKWWPDFFRIEANLTKSKVVMHTLGNHEVQEGTYYYWNDFYIDAFPTNGPPGTNGRVYSFDYGNVHFVNLSTYQVNLDLQTTWLIADLTAAKARPNIKWIFAFFHAPMFTNSGHPNRTDCIQRWGPVFDQFGVNAVFQGHNHVYERTYPLITYYDTTLGTPVWTGKVVPDGEGTVYITNGMGGAEFNNTSTTPLIAVGFGASNLNTTVVVSFTIDGSSRVIVDAIRNDTGAVIDTYDILPRTLKCDFNKDGIIDMKDLGVLAGSWLDTGMWP